MRSTNSVIVKTKTGSAFLPAPASRVRFLAKNSPIALIQVNIVHIEDTRNLIPRHSFMYGSHDVAAPSSCSSL